MHSYARAVPLVLLLASLTACSKEQSPEPKPQDQKPPSNQPASAGDSTLDGLYKSSCAPCHGTDGKGDGPMGRSLRVADLSSVAWQERVSDEEIAEVIKKGRGKMPAFDLPPEKVDGLVKKVRSFRK